MDYCEENGIDEDLNEEFEVEAQESMLVDFDEDNFPFPDDEELDDEEAKKEWIFDLLHKIREDPDIDFSLNSKLI